MYRQCNDCNLPQSSVLLVEVFICVREGQKRVVLVLLELVAGCFAYNPRFALAYVPDLAHICTANHGTHISVGLMGSTAHRYIMVTRGRGGIDSNDAVGIGFNRDRRTKMGRHGGVRDKPGRERRLWAQVATAACKHNTDKHRPRNESSPWLSSKPSQNSSTALPQCIWIINIMCTDVVTI